MLSNLVCAKKLMLVRPTSPSGKQIAQLEWRLGVKTKINIASPARLEESLAPNHSIRIGFDRQQVRQ